MEKKRFLGEIERIDGPKEIDLKDGAEIYAVRSVFLNEKPTIVIAYSQPGRNGVPHASFPLAAVERVRQST